MKPNTTYVGVPGNDEGVESLTILRINYDSDIAEVEERRFDGGSYKYVKPIDEIHDELTRGILRES